MSKGFCTAVILAAFPLIAAVKAEDFQLGAAYTCKEEHIVVQSCNVRDASDNATCTVAHPDQPKHNGFTVLTYETRGSLKKLLPTCQPPSAGAAAAANRVRQVQQEKYEANVRKADEESRAIEDRASAVITGQPPISSEERSRNRCLASGRNPELCDEAAFGNFVLSGIRMIVPQAAATPTGGLVFAGSYRGPGNWSVDFGGGQVFTGCATLSPEPRSFSIRIANGVATLNIEATPKPLVMTLRPDGTLANAGPMTIDGSILPGSSGTSSGPAFGHWQYDPYTASHSPTTPTMGGGYVWVGADTTHVAPERIPRTENCVQAVVRPVNPSSDPAGLRMSGTFVAQGGFSIEFYGESAVVGCGEPAHAFPYVVTPNGSQAIVRIQDPQHPLVLAMKAGGQLDPGEGTYEVHGRTLTGRNSSGNYTFSPINATCKLGAMAVGRLPSSSMVAAVTAPAAPATAVTTVPNAPPGSAVLTVSSGFPTQPGSPNQLAGRRYNLLRESFAAALAKGGVKVPQGTSPYMMIGLACGPTRTPDCEKIGAAVNAVGVSTASGDTSGNATFGGVPPGTYYVYLMTSYNNHVVVWDIPVTLKAGPNSAALGQTNMVTVK